MSNSVYSVRKTFSRLQLPLLLSKLLNGASAYSFHIVIYFKKKWNMKSNQRGSFLWEHPACLLGHPRKMTLTEILIRRNCLKAALDWSLSLICFLPHRVRVKSLPSHKHWSVLFLMKEVEPPDGFSLSIVALHESLISVHTQLCGDEVFFHVVNNLFNI